MNKWTIPILMIILLSCKKDDDHSKEGLPTPVAALFENDTHCSECPYEVHLVSYISGKYYMVVPTSNGTSICDYFGIPLYDKDANVIDYQSVLHSNVLKFGSDRGVVFSCRH